MNHQNEKYIEPIGYEIGSPIAIGGVGGSGTRLVAEIIIRSGIDLGSNLNKSNDDLDFTARFKRKEWFRNFPKARDIENAWHLYLQDRQIKNHVLQDSSNIFSGTPWGWKEPNTHIFLDVLSKIVPNLRYIHVLRNGLDMSISKNQQQATNWSHHILGHSFGKTLTPTNSLEYWLQANTRAIENGHKLGDRFLLLKYEELCRDPITQIERLIDFIACQADIRNLVKLIAPTSIERYKNQDITLFSDDDIQQVEAIMNVQL